MQLAASPTSTDRLARCGAPTAGITRFSDLWHHEWHRLRRRTDVLEQATAWRLLDAPVGDLDEILDRVGFDRRPSDHHERAMRRLVEIAVHDQLAARIVIQRILPGLISIARRRARFGAAHHALEDLVGAAWIVIRTFNLDRRPACIAAALLGDVNEQTFRTARRRAAREEPLEHHVDLAPVASPNPADELVGLARCAVDAGIADDADLELLASLVAEDRAIDAAARLEVTARTYRNRRDRLTERLREAATAA